METKQPNWIALAATALGVLVLVLSLALDWGELDLSVSGPFGGSGQSSMGYTLFSLDDTSWYDNDLDDTDGVSNIRAAIPTVLVGLVFAALCAAAFALPPGRLTAGPRLGGVFGVLAAVLVLIGATLHYFGAVEIADGLTGSAGGASSDATARMGIGSILAYVAAVLVSVGAVLGFLARPAARA